MKEFRTEIKMTSSGDQIQLKGGVLTQGSCFADAIGQRLLTHKMQALVNPFGVIYNPLSIHKVVSYAVSNEPVPAHTFVQHQEIFVNVDFHSDFSSLNREELSAHLTKTIEATHVFLKDAEWLLLTYGTASVYRRHDTGEIVANCHKLPSARFTKARLTPADIESSFEDLYGRLKRFNPDLKVIVTVSPVRHLRDTLELNAVSKSVLRLACHHIAIKHADVQYFPAYEIMMDDLRDYRFYKADMLHPTAEAEDYIWEKFMERYFSPEVKDFIQKWKVILSALRHKPFHPSAAAHQQFLQDTLKKLDDISASVDVRDEISLIKQQLINK